MMISEERGWKIGKDKGLEVRQESLIDHECRYPGIACDIPSANYQVFEAEPYSCDDVTNME